MIDNKPLEEEAESFVKSKLLRYKFNISKPSFDIKGADLLILDNIENHYSRILKVQSKGRTLKKTSNSIKIHESYVTDDFIVFLYAIDSNNIDTEYFFTFFKEDIITWNKSNHHYVLSFTSNSILNDSFQAKKFGENTAKKIHALLGTTQIKKYTSVIVDGIFLQKTITKTLNLYQKMYPEKHLTRPSIEDVIYNISSMYNRYTSEENIINYHIYDYNEHIDYPKVVDGNIIVDNGMEKRIYFHETNGFIYEDIEEYFQKVINLENIVFVADDIIYEPLLHKLTDDGIDVILVMLSELAGNNMFTKHKWGDVEYSIAQAMGLGRYEW